MCGAQQRQPAKEMDDLKVATVTLTGDSGRWTNADNDPPANAPAPEEANKARAPESTAALRPSVVDFPPLPEGWTEQKANEKATVYYLHESGKTSWKRPVPETPVQTQTPAAICVTVAGTENADDGRKIAVLRISAWRNPYICE